MYSKSCSSVRANTEAESVAEAGGVSSAVAVDAVDGLLYIATGAIIAPAPTDSGTDAVAQSTSEGDEGGDQEEVPILCVRVWRCVHTYMQWHGGGSAWVGSCSRASSPYSWLTYWS
jgi:hypothetical protein